MPEKQKDVIVKSKSVQGFHKPHEIEDGLNIFERQVDSISTAADCDKTIGEKSSTLPPGQTRSGLLIKNHRNKKPSQAVHALLAPHGPKTNWSRGSTSIKTPLVSHLRIIAALVLQ